MKTRTLLMMIVSIAGPACDRSENAQIEALTQAARESRDAAYQAGVEADHSRAMKEARRKHDDLIKKSEDEYKALERKIDDAAREREVRAGLQ